MTERPIDSITIGQRHRRDFSGVAMLADSIKRVGLLQPPGVTPDGRLLWGECRLRACRELGWTGIPVIVKDVDPEDMAAVEAAENFARKDFTPSEAVAIKRTLEPEMKAEAERRMKAGQPCANFAQGKTRERTAALTGYSHTTLDKAEAVVDAATTEPERFGKLVEDMDRGKVDRAYKALQIARAREAYEARKEQGGTVADLAALAASGFRASVIVADPSWLFRVYSGNGKERSADRHYDTQSLDWLKNNLPVESLAAPDCKLFLWTTWPHLFEAGELMKAWGFSYSTCGFLWVKLNRSGDGFKTGMGYSTRANSEPCLLATRGAPLRLDMGVHQLIISPVLEHSRKPEEAQDRVEQLYVGPYLELFARRERPGWKTWGNEVPPPEYDSAADMSASIEVCYRAIKERQAAGGPGFDPERKPPDNDEEDLKALRGLAHSKRMIAQMGHVRVTSGPGPKKPEPLMPEPRRKVIQKLWPRLSADDQQTLAEWAQYHNVVAA